VPSGREGSGRSPARRRTVLGFRAGGGDGADGEHPPSASPAAAAPAPIKKLRRGSVTGPPCGFAEAGGRATLRSS
jgi:hypothetical protein